MTAAAGAPLTGTEGAALTGVTVATFSDANPNATVNDFTAMITWGDGSTSAGTVVATSNGFAVTGTHTYDDEGSYLASVAITDKGGSTANASTTVTVNDAALTAAAAAPLTGTEGTALTGVTVATFSDANPDATVNDFTAMITWGDGSTSAGTVVATGNGFAVTYTPGAGPDTLYMRANDGTAWSAWTAGFTATDGAPVSTPVHTVVSGAGGKTYAVSELFTVSDADGDAPTQYDFWDNGAGGGHWSINGVPQASNQDILVNASQLSQVTYQAGSGTDTIYLRATDGLHFGAWTSGVTVANAPVANLNQSAFILSHTQSTAASTLFTATDADSDPIIQYDFWDNGAGGGHWSINGVAQGSNTVIMVTASQLSQVTYTPGAGTDTLFVRVNDRSGARGHRASPPPTGHP